MFALRFSFVFSSLAIIMLCGNGSRAQDVNALSMLPAGEAAPKSTGTDLSNFAFTDDGRRRLFRGATAERRSPTAEWLR
jgi:hypothetical protein